MSRMAVQNMIPWLSASACSTPSPWPPAASCLSLHHSSAGQRKRAGFVALSFLQGGSGGRACVWGVGAAAQEERLPTTEQGIVGGCKAPRPLT